MKKILLLHGLLFFIAVNAISQNLTAKEKAESLAKEEFSKSKEKRKEKNGIVTEMKIVVESTPVVKDNLSYYDGNYVYKDLDYKIEIRPIKNKSRWLH